MQVAAAWFTAQGDRPRVNAAFSSDGGQSFGQTMKWMERTRLDALD